jgi:glycosyltransferase involved in cell wall biosynthesis
MRILFVTPLFFPMLSGAAVYFDILSRGILKLEPSSDITILTRFLKGAPVIERRGQVKVLRLLPNKLIKYFPGFQNRVSGFLTPLVVLAVSRFRRIDLVHYHTLASYRGIHLLARFFRAPLIGDMRDLAAKHEGASLKYYTHCKRLICASENIFEFLLSGGFSSEKLVRIPIPFEKPKPTPSSTVKEVKVKYGIPLDSPYILFVGAIIPYKGVLELLQAMEFIWERFPEFHLVLAGPLTNEGNSQFPGGFISFIRKYQRAHHLGPVAHSENLILIQGAEIFVLPSRTEGLPRSCLEAISLGKKVILPPGIPEFEKFCPESVLEEIAPNTIARKIEMVLGSKKSAVYPLDNHESSKIAFKTFDLYRSVLDG